MLLMLCPDDRGKEKENAMRGLLDCPAPRSKTSCNPADVVRAAERVLAGAAEREAKVNPSSNAVVEVRGFGFSYGTFRALDGVSFEAYAGEVFALCGPRGCGAQTMLCAIGNTLPGAGEWESEGDIHVAGTSVFHDVSPDRARNLAATAFASGLPEAQSVRNALARPLRLRGMHADAALHDAICDALAAMGVKDRLASHRDERVCALAPLDQRLVRLAQALLHDPRALLVEEPTRGLSLDDAAIMRKALRGIAADGRRAVVVESCDAREVESLADRAALFLEGRLVEVGPPGDLASLRADYRARSFFEGRMR